jgi:ribosomal protein L27
MNKTYRPTVRQTAVILGLIASTPLFGANRTMVATANHNLVTADSDLSTNRLLVATGSNWVGGAANPPVNGDDLFFGNNTAGNRLAVFSQAAANPTSVNSLNFTQTSAFINRLDVRTPLTVTNDITLGASSGAQVVLRVDTANVNSNSGTDRLSTYTAQTTASSTALTVSNITVNSGGSLVFARQFVGTTNTLPQYLNGNVTIDGGSFIANRGRRPAASTGTNTNTATSLNYIIGGNFTLNSGTISLAPDDANYADTGTGAGTELPDSRVQINGHFTTSGGSITSANSSNADLNLVGATNSIHASTNLNTTDLTLTSLVDNANQSLTSGATLNSLVVTGAGNSVKTVTALSQVGNIIFRQNGTSGKLTLKLGADLELKSGSSLSVATLGSGTTQDLTIDTNGFALNGSAGSVNFNNSAAARASDWTVTGGGSLSAGSMIFSATGNSTLPDLTVTAGTDLTAASFDATNVGTITLGVGGLADFARVSAPVQTFAGALVVNLTAAPAAGSYQLFGAAGGTGDFASVSITGAESVSLSGLNAWSGSSLDFNYTFSELSGLLTISSTAIPEPGTFAALAGLLGLGFAGLRRRRA